MKSGYVAITGKPNVGKSTFLNTVLKRKVAITSPKPQTTRNQIHAVLDYNDTKIQFVDTPGWHAPNFKLDLFLNSQIKNSYKIADVVLLFIDLTRPIDDEDKEIIKLLKEYEVEKVILVLTKSDVSSVSKITNYETQIKNDINVLETVVISSKKQSNVDVLLNKIVDILPQGNKLEQLYDNDNFVISEIIREQIIFNTKQELPYATGVYIESNNYDHIAKLLTIQAIILVEKESQKPIVIGKGGSMIKKIGTMARKELLDIFDTKINLKLFVKVQSEWRNNEKVLSEIGYSNKK
ncbi:MAG: GTPase Era [Mycoplasmataceae bacterium]|nr:GTPase Era [Mycoplasmataceae bacterium]